MKQKMRTIALYFFTLPWDLTVAWPAVLLVRALWGRNLRWEKSPTGLGVHVLACDLSEGTWPARTWYAKWGGTSLGHGIFYGASPGAAERVRAHEHVHVEQFESSMFWSFVNGLWVGAVGHWWMGLLVWWLGYFGMAAGGWAVAWLRGEDFYRGSAHEEAARAQTEDK